jgi:CHASE3 domain sensor protein
MLLSLADTLQAAGRKAEAIAACKAALADPTVELRHRQTAEQKLQAIEGDKK